MGKVASLDVLDNFIGNEPTREIDGTNETEEANSSNVGNVETNEIDEFINKPTKIFGRGRHKKDCDCEKCIRKYGPVEGRGRINPSSNNIKQPSNSNGNAPGENASSNAGKSRTNKEIESEFREELSDEGESETETADGEIIEGDEVETEVEQPILISGALFLIICDNIIPQVILLGAKWLGQGKNKKPKDLQLTEDEMRKLEPLAEVVAQELMGNMGPIAQFCTAYGSIVVGKLLT